VEPVTLRTARLVLDQPTDGDVDAIYEACQDPDIQRYTRVPSPYTRADAEKFITAVAEQWAGELHRTWVIREGATLVGTIGFYRLDGQGNGEIGFWVAPDRRGDGRLREAANTVIDWGFSSEGGDLTRIEWRAVVGNVASAKVAQTLGFRYEGTLRQALVSSHGRDDGWLAALLTTDERMPQPWPVLAH
jgi:RimJ/RimL family protein N-acetyltransferase